MRTVPTGTSSAKGDLVVTEVGERVEKQRIALPRPHRCESACQPRAESRVVDTCGRLVVIGDPGVDTAPGVRSELTELGPTAAVEEMRRDAVQPRQDAVDGSTARPSLEGDRERLCSQLVGEIASGASMEIPVNGLEMPIEDRFEGCRLTQRARQAIRVRRS